MNRARVDLLRADAQRADQHGANAATSSPRGGWGVERENTWPGPNTYRLAFLRFAQYAFMRLDTAFLAAALSFRRFRLVLDFVLG